MKSTLRIALALAVAACAFSVCPVQAAGENKAPVAARGERGKAARERMQQMAAELNLTAAQKEKLQPILRQQAVELRELRQNQDLAPREKQEKLRALRQEFEGRMKAVLTEDQFAKWEGKRKEMRAEAMRKRTKVQ